jgi:hypothetical protein
VLSLRDVQNVLFDVQKFIRRQGLFFAVLALAGFGGKAEYAVEGNLRALTVELDRLDDSSTGSLGSCRLPGYCLAKNWFTKSSVILISLALLSVYWFSIVFNM